VSPCLRSEKNGAGENNGAGSNIDNCQSRPVPRSAAPSRTARQPADPPAWPGPGRDGVTDRFGSAGAAFGPTRANRVQPGACIRRARSRRRDRIGAVTGPTAPGFRIAEDDPDDVPSIRSWGSIAFLV
jgi:hypothetical protein